MKNALLKNFFVLSLGLVLSTFYLPLLSADEDSPDNDVIDMVVGDIQSVEANNLTRVSVTDPDVADISDAEGDKVSLIAKRAGSTVLFLWDANGKRSIRIRVASEDLATLKASVGRILDEAGISGVSVDEDLDRGKLILTGQLSKEDKIRLTEVLEPYSDNLVNYVREEKSEDLIQVDMQIIEISTTLEQNLGIEWGNSGASSTSATSTPSTTGGGGSGVQLGYGEQGVPFGDKAKDLFKIGNFERTTPLQATVNALLQEGKARLISKPRLVVISGKQASFLVGGEIPIQNTTTSASGGTQQSSTTYTQYGVNLSVTPTIREGKIDVLLNVDIRDVDNSSSFSTNSNVAFITRTASTDLLMDNRQTIVLAGLIKYSDSVTETGVPFLSKIPIVGALFRDKNIPGDSNTEMVIILTPTVLTEKKFAEKQTVYPTPDERSAWKEVESKYEHEPIVSSWPAPKAAGDVSANNPSSIDEGGAGPGSLPVVAAYARTVQEKISRAIEYPSDAQGDVEGTVKLKLLILKDGSLGSEEVVESSGNDILDRDAMQAAKTAAPYDAFSDGMDQNDLIFTVPIVYNKPEKVIGAY